MSGRPKIFDEAAVIDKAIALFWTQGYEGTSTDALLEAMGIGKGSFYLAFKGGKKELFEKALLQFSRRELTMLREILTASKDPIATLRNFFLDIAASPKKTHLKGCFMGNTIAELSSLDPSLTKQAAQLLKDLEALFLEVIRKAVENKQLKTQQDPVVLARYLLNLWNGLGITRRMYPDQKTLTDLIALQLTLLH
ncbi:TetR/AcrR family transcriptional regulator [Chitinophaga nivalis]|uniref:TetR/AcrR family transcriptional regulator n=1 Tax=Chitinophaga nivalis TaxID=2991709 RepID=A0ABT3IQG4_9BACT|nr:TetR/AcrR family transcriptional regulator [Chitinophaga nivalis]MCW3464132.1 TetR/AcrR family transcriptional regulator [Chitinophaga nivalis]MCW3486178.1 TetR/AcrR family transcriptional regulator [Chitinophaga nivalis]